MQMTDLQNKNHIILEMCEVFKSYPVTGGNEKLVLNNINLKVSKGSFVTIVGPTGCGKSTMFRLLLGQEKPSSGTIRVNGQAITGPDRDRGVVFQRYSLFPHLTVAKNVAYGLELEEFTLLGRFFNPIRYYKSKSEFIDSAYSYLKRVGLADSADKYPNELSGGMRQRASIAQALIMKPEILFMDEPFGALDEGTRMDMQAYMLELWEDSGMTVFFVTHDLEEALYLGTRILVLSQYYLSEAGDNSGSKIVIDKSIPGKSPRPMSSRYTPDFSKLLEQIRLEGLNPKYKQRIEEFDLSHRLAK
jgi:NitT/TauT family transport system ATP-binding protein